MAHLPVCGIYALPYAADPTERFERLRDAPGAVLLDSGRPHSGRGRFDLMSAWPLEQAFPAEPEGGLAYFDRLRGLLERLGPARAPSSLALPFVGGLIGYLGYDFGRRLERLPAQAISDLNLPDAGVGLYAWACISDHDLQTCHLVFHPSMEEAERRRLVRLMTTVPTAAGAKQFRLAQPFAHDLCAQAYRQSFERIKAYIAAGDCYQVNFAQRFQAPYEGDAFTAYRSLRRACPTPFAGYLATRQGAVLSLSPERFLAVHESRVETRPIKGTRARAADAAQDHANAQALLASEKDRAENLMIVDLLRNDLGRVCQTGSVRVPQLFTLESYPNVHHLVSCVTGTLAAGRDALDLLAGSFPGGSITGAPKIRAMQIIDELEPTRRALYCGSLFYLDVRGELDSSIAIRSLLAEDGRLYCWGGGGIVADSECEAEYLESLTKVRVLLETLESHQAPPPLHGP